MATENIAAWASALKYSDLPQPVINAAIRSFYNYIGCMVGGRTHEAVKITTESFVLFASRDQFSSLLGTGMATDPLQAALVNGLASHIHDYDDTHLETVIHPTGTVASALLAYAEFSSRVDSPISGQNFLCALIAGIEVECLLGLAVWPSHYDVGWHITCTVGSIGAAVAVGKAMRMSIEQMRNAIGIASSQATGMREHFGSHTKALGVGKAAQAGLQAAFLAQNEMTASKSALEGTRGWVACVCPNQEQGLSRLQELVVALASGVRIGDDHKWEIEKNTFKPFPCGIVIHPVIDGCIQLHKEGLETDKVEHVELLVHPLVLELTGKMNPRDGLEGKFSVYHGAACGLLYGRASPSEYTDEVVVRTADLRKKIYATIDKTLRPDECRIVINSGEYSKHVQHAIGSLKAPMTNEQLEVKFLSQCTPVMDDEEAGVLNKRLWEIDTARDIKVLFSSVGDRS